MNLISEMGDDEKVDAFYKERTITDFLFSFEHPIAKSKMFENVNPTILGFKDLIVSNISSGDTEAYLTIQVGELSRDIVSMQSMQNLKILLKLTFNQKIQNRKPSAKRV
jgi:dihydroorotate dehydrogenase